VTAPDGDLLALGGDAAAALEAMGYIAVARKRDGVVTVEYRKIMGERQYLMRHVLTDATMSAADLAAKCDTEFQAALMHHE
jgi:hypothetical protein